MLTALCLPLQGCAAYARHLIDTKALTTGPNGKDTPGTLGAPYERQSIASGDRRLDSYIVTADPACVDAPVLVIYHGVQETISNWVKAQRFLYDHCVSSVVFDYAGSGDSSRPADFDAMDDDCVAAYEFVVRRFPGRRIYVLGHSMGNGPLLEATPRFSPQPDGVIVANALESLRSFAVGSGNTFYKVLSYAIPDWWDSAKNISGISAPVLVIHSDTDQVNPLEGARHIFAAAQQPKDLVILHSHAHNDLYRKPEEDWWGPVLDFMRPARFKDSTAE